jgi:hypothetical protein
MATAVGAEPVAGVAEVCSLWAIVDGFEDHTHGFLNDCILYAGHTQSTLPHHPHEFRDG